MYDLPDLGRQLLSLRKKRGLTVRQVAKLAGCSYQYVSALENGDIASPTLPGLNKVVKALGGDLGIEIKEAEHSSLTHDEQALLANYRKTDSEGQALLQDLAVQWETMEIGDRRTLRGLLDLWRRSNPSKASMNQENLE